jgi:hypothetical protein
MTMCKDITHGHLDKSMKGILLMEKLQGNDYTFGPREKNMRAILFMEK